MPVETVVIRITQDTTELVKTIDQLEKLGIIDKNNARQFKQSEQQFEQGQRRAQQSIRQTNNEMTNTGRSIGVLDRQFRNLGATIAGVFAVQKIANFTKSIIDARAEVEYTQVAFETLLGSATKASKLLKDLATFAARTPFTIPEVENAAKQLLAYGFQAEEIIDTTRRLGDVSAALKVPLNDIIYLYGTSRVQGRLYARDIYQFTNRGINIVSALADQYGVAENAVAKLVEEGKVGFPQVEAAFKAMTNEGGIFFNLMDKQAKTTGGQISNLEDDFILLKREIGEELAPVIQSIVSDLRSFVQSLSGEDVVNFGKFVLLAVQALVSYRLVVRSAAAAQNLFNKSVFSSPLIGGKFTRALSSAVPIIGTIISVVGLATTAFELFSDETDDLTDKQKELEDQLRDTTRELDKQRKVLGNVSEASLQDLKDTERLIQNQLDQLSKSDIRQKISAEVIKSFSPDRFNEIVNQGGKFDDPVTALFAEANKSVTDEAINARFNAAKKTLLANLASIQKEIAKRQKAGLPPNDDAEKAAERQAKLERKQFNEFLELLFDKDNAEREVSEESLKRAKLKNRQELTNADDIRKADLDAEITHIENIIELNIFKGEKLLDLQIMLEDKKRELREQELKEVDAANAEQVRITQETQARIEDILRHRANIAQEISDNLFAAVIFNEKARVNEIVKGGATIEEAERQVSEERARAAENLFKSTIDIILKELQAVLQAEIFKAFARTVASGVALPVALAQATAKTVAITAAFSTARAAVNSLTFHEGTDYVPGQGGIGLRRDESWAKLQQGEGVITTRMNKRYPGLVSAINQGKVDEWFINQPTMHGKDLQQIKRESFNNTIRELFDEKGEFTDAAIVEGLRKGRKQDVSNTDKIIRAIKDQGHNPWGINR